jgi:hypothetical protein
MYDGSNIIVYINGLFNQTTNVRDGVLSASSSAVAIGNRVDAGDTRWWEGKLADVCVHNRPLSAPEIQILANRSDPFLNGLIRPIGSESNIYDREGIR